MNEDEARRADEFVKELTKLSHKYGIGIDSAPTLFVLEQDDYALEYSVDSYSRLVWE